MIKTCDIILFCEHTFHSSIIVLFVITTFHYVFITHSLVFKRYIVINLCFSIITFGLQKYDHWYFVPDVAIRPDHHGVHLDNMTEALLGEGSKEVRDELNRDLMRWVNGPDDELQIAFVDSNGRNAAAAWGEAPLWTIRP